MSPQTDKLDKFFLYKTTVKLLLNKSLKPNILNLVAQKTSNIEMLCAWQMILKRAFLE